MLLMIILFIFNLTLFSVHLIHVVHSFVCLNNNICLPNGFGYERVALNRMSQPVIVL